MDGVYSLTRIKGGSMRHEKDDYLFYESILEDSSRLNVFLIRLRKRIKEEANVERKDKLQKLYDNLCCYKNNLMK